MKFTLNKFYINKNNSLIRLSRRLATLRRSLLKDCRKILKAGAKLRSSHLMRKRDGKWRPSGGYREHFQTKLGKRTKYTHGTDIRDRFFRQVRPLLKTAHSSACAFHVKILALANHEESPRFLDI